MSGCDVFSPLRYLESLDLVSVSAEPLPQGFSSGLILFEQLSGKAKGPHDRFWELFLKIYYFRLQSLEVDDDSTGRCRHNVHLFLKCGL